MLLKPGRGDLVGLVELDPGESLPIHEIDLVGDLGDFLKPSLRGEPGGGGGLLFLLKFFLTSLTNLITRTPPF